MTQEKSLELSENFKVLGAGKVLPYLRGDISQAQKSLFVIGPWIDGFFTQELVSVFKKSLIVRFLVRLENVEKDVRLTTLQSLRLAASSVSSFEARSLRTLHAKSIIIDSKIAYIGSTNWYKYSLEQSHEVTLRCTSDTALELERVLKEYWEKASPINSDSVISTFKDIPKELSDEVLDPLARKVLDANPKAFIKRIKK